jgi:hypothetical protein
MANRTYLMAHSNECATTAELAEDACLLGANYQVPILWIALFDSSDLTYVDVPCTDSEGKDVLEKIPTLFTSYAKARAIYDARRAGLEKALAPAHHRALREWEEFLSMQIHGPVLQLDLIELWMMYDGPADLALDIQDWLKGVSSQSGQEWKNLCSQANLEDPEVSKYGLRGFPWNAKVAWA